MLATNLPYVLPRLARHFLPERLTRFLLLHSIIINAGLETTDAKAAAQRYLEVMQKRGRSIQGKRVLVFGYGGRFDIALALLDAGAGHVALLERYALPDDKHNAALIPHYPQYLEVREARTLPRPASITLLQADVRDLQTSAGLPAFDYVFSSSVYEHLNDVDAISGALASLTKADGFHIHYVDLRDHFFKYPFEMLTFSERVWRGWLNPTSNHNRLRFWHYRRVFETYFKSVDIEVLERDGAAFEKIHERIRPEFISGNLQDDSVTLILVTATHPRPVSEQ